MHEIFPQVRRQNDDLRFFARIEQLNSYVPVLLCLKDIDQVTYLTAPVNVSFLEHELAVIILQCMPKIYDDQYWLSTFFSDSFATIAYEP